MTDVINELIKFVSLSGHVMFSVYHIEILDTVTTASIIYLDMLVL